MSIKNHKNIAWFALTVVLSLMSVGAIVAQDFTSDDIKYRRSSLYSLLINHTEQSFADEIRAAYLSVPVPDKFNDHNLSVRVIDMDEKLAGARKNRENQEITDFLETNQVASRLVARWFNRDFLTGACDINLVSERGLYNASEIDKAIARKSARGTAMLADAGEDLIGNTFVVVNDIRYLDKGERSGAWGTALKLGGTIWQFVKVFDTSSSSSSSSSSDIGDLLVAAGEMVETIKGFKVRINTFLYQLVWDDEVAATFYDTWQVADQNPSPEPFNQIRGNFHLKYVGKVESKGSTTSFLGIREDQPLMMIRKACQRALDENIADLQHDFEAFRTKSPLISDHPLRAYVGLKEGVSESSRFEVLEAEEDKNGRIVYKRVGIIKPKKGLVWDNRYMAEEEHAENATLGFTTFEKVKGGPFHKGMLIREIDK